jgi:hypothetical protein
MDERDPVFLRNMSDLWGMCRDAEDRVAVLVLFAPIANRWLDRTAVKGDADALRVVRCLRELLRQVADWSELQGAGALHEIVRLDKRLGGLGSV